MSVATAHPSASGSGASPHSILRPCSSVVAPSKDAAGNRSLGWLAAPPRELCAPRPGGAVVPELQPQAQQFNSLEASQSHGSLSATSSRDGAKPTQSRAPGSPTSDAETLSSNSNSVPPLSPSQSQSSMTPSLPETVSEDEAANGGNVTPRSHGVGSPSPSIRFGALPERPPELRRRNSITLGVLARKNMLHAQGTVPGGPRKVMMTDDQWEAYQASFASQRNTKEAVDLGAVVKNGARNFFGKLRRGSNASTTSTGSQGSSSAPSILGGRHHTDSGPSQASVTPHGRPVDVAPTLQEVDEDVGEAGEETPRRGRSPSPTHHAPHQHHHFERSPSPPREVFHDENEDEDDADNDEFEEAQDLTVNGTRNSVENGARVPTDDAQYEHMSNNMSTQASLGFEMNDYTEPPAWGRRNSAHEPSRAA